MQIPVIVQTTGLLILSNNFMTIAWYGHLKNMSNRVWWYAAIVSWGIALFEYLCLLLKAKFGDNYMTLLKEDVARRMREAPLPAK